MNSAVNKKKKSGRTSSQGNREIFGVATSFAAKEAYKLLRTNLLFALPDTKDGRAHIIGVTSSLRGEGKSTTTVNLTSALAEQNKRVILVEGDLRIPSIHKKLRLRSKPGVTNILVNRAAPEAYMQQFKFKVGDKSATFDVLVAGDIPPNPSELMGSRRMRDLIDYLSTKYDYILLDLPPVTAVTDALVAMKLVDGMVMVVRNEYADRNSLNEAIRQIRLVDGKIFGFVYTCANSGFGSYGKKYKYRYYKRYKDYK